MPTRNERLAELLLLAFKDKDDYTLANLICDLIPCDKCPMNATRAMRSVAEGYISCVDLLEEYLNMGE